MFTTLPLIIKAFEPRHCTNMTFNFSFTGSFKQIGNRISNTAGSDFFREKHTHHFINDRNFLALQKFI